VPEAHLKVVTMTIFLHSILITLRAFSRHKVSFFINLTGLALGLFCAFLIYLWVANELAMDRFHENDAHLYKVMEHQQYQGEVITTSSTPGILAETLKEELPEVKYAVTTTWVNPANLAIDRHVIQADGYYVGEDYFNVFSFPLLQGDRSLVLKQKEAIVVSESLAERLFGTAEGVLGKEVLVDESKTHVVTGVFADIRGRSSERFDFVLPFEMFKEFNEWVLAWGNNGPPTYVVLHEGTDPEAVNAKIKNFVAERNEESNVTLFLKKYSDHYLYGRYDNGVQDGGRIEYVQLFSLVGVFILIIAGINFMNLATARATYRAREVGVKKAIGAGKRMLITQFIGESVVLAFLALGIAFLAVALVLPTFNEITGKEVALTFDIEVIASFLLITLLTGLFAGSYPALYLTSFAPVKVLKGQLRGSIGELWVRRGLVVFQFTLSIMLIVVVMVVYKQIEFVQDQNLGYNSSNVISIATSQAAAGDKTRTFAEEAKKIPGVLAVSSSGHRLIGQQTNTSGLEWEGKDPEALILFENITVDYGLLELMEIELVQGRSFSHDFPTDTGAIILNEAGLKATGLKDPIGKKVRLWDQHELTIIGIAKDFHFQSFHSQIEPVFFRMEPSYNWNVLIRIAPENRQAAIDRLSRLYHDFFPSLAFDFRFFDDEFQKQYVAEQRVAGLSQYFAAFAVLISCLGLFGLAAFTAERRKKEIGIRKVLGAGEWRIILLITGSFTKMVLAAILISLPLSYWAVATWLERFAYRIELGLWYFLGAAAIALLVAWATVAGQAIKSSRINPVSSLKQE